MPAAGFHSLWGQCSNTLDQAHTTTAQKCMHGQAQFLFVTHHSLDMLASEDQIQLSDYNSHPSATLAVLSRQTWAYGPTVSTHVFPFVFCKRIKKTKSNN